MDPPEDAPPVTKFYLGQAECRDCDWEKTGHGSDVGEEAWRHSSQQLHDVEAETVKVVIQINDAERATHDLIGGIVSDEVKRVNESDDSYSVEVKLNG